VASKLHGVEVDIKIIKRKGDPLDDITNGDITRKNLANCKNKNITSEKSEY
jgi:hypothetical protein